jgi:hypothetical protein
VGFSIEVTPNGKKSILALPNQHVGSAIRDLVLRIGQDPITMTKSIIHGSRMWDGMILANGLTYYAQILFDHIPTSGKIVIRLVTTQLASGPH